MDKLKNEADMGEPKSVEMGLDVADMIVRATIFMPLDARNRLISASYGVGIGKWREARAPPKKKPQAHPALEKIESLSLQRPQDVRAIFGDTLQNRAPVFAFKLVTWHPVFCKTLAFG